MFYLSEVSSLPRCWVDTRFRIPFRVLKTTSSVVCLQHTVTKINNNFNSRHPIGKYTNDSSKLLHGSPEKESARAMSCKQYKALVEFYT